MDTVTRLILGVRLAVVAVLVFWSGGAWAADTYWLTSSLNGVSARGTSPDNACTNMYAKQTGGVYTLEYTTMVSATSYRCFGRKDGGTVQQYGSANQYTCPASTPYLDPATLACVGTPPQPTCSAGVSGTGTWGVGPTGGPYNFGVMDTGGCVNSCKVNLGDVKSCHKNGDGTSSCTFSTKTTGESCTPGPDSPSPGTPPTSDTPRTDVPPITPSTGKCPGGTVQGGVTADGVPICIGTGTDPKNAPPPQPKIETEKTEPTPDGGSKTTQTSTTTNSDGSTTTTTTTTTTAPDGTKSTTVDKNTTTNLSGGAGKDDSNREDDKYDLCKQNPMLAVCRNSSVSGTCGQISCEGDAIQCATLRAAAAMECKQREEETKLKGMASTGLGEAILGGTDPMGGAIADAMKGTEVDMSQPNIDDSGFVAAQCIGDKSFVFSGHTIEVPFSRWCGVIEPLKYAIVACAWIIAYQIVSRSVLSA